MNLATLFARRGLKTLLLDADIGLGNANLLLGLQPERTMEDVLFGSSPVESVFMPTPYGFTLLPGSSGIRKLLELDNFSQRAVFDRLFEAMKGFEVVVYDTAPGIGNWVLNFNAAAHDIVVVAHPDPMALADAYALMKVLSLERREKKFRLLINRSKHAQEGLDAFRHISDVTDEYLNVSVDYMGSLPEDPWVLKSVCKRVPIVAEAPKSPFSLGLDRLADKLLAQTGGGSAVKTWNNVGVRPDLRGA